MENVDIMDAVQLGIESVLYKQWRHKGYIDGFNSSQVIFVVDSKRYILNLVDNVNYSE